MNGMHLTDEQIEDLLMGEAADDARAHAAECGVCCERVAADRSALRLFGEASMAWGERRSAGMPLPSGRTAPRSAWLRVPVMGTAAAVVAVALGISVVKDFEGRRTPAIAHGSAGAEAGRNSAAQRAADQIAADNRMLSEIDQELTAETPSVLEASQSAEASRDGRKAAAVEVRD